MAKALDQMKIPYVIVGAISVIVHGRIRTTLDIDVILDHNKIEPEIFISTLNKYGFDIFANDLVGFDEKIHVSMFYKKTMFRIDMKGVYDPKEEISIREAEPVEYLNTIINIDSPKNLILNKLIFGSTQDLEDALSVLTSYPELCYDQTLIHRIKEYNLLSKFQELVTRIKSNQT